MVVCIVVISDVAHLAVVWSSVVMYNEEGLMDKLWRRAEMAFSGMEGVLVA